MKIDFKFAHECTARLLEGVSGYDYRATFGLVMKLIAEIGQYAAWSKILKIKEADEQGVSLTDLPAIEGVSEKQVTYATDVRARRILPALKLCADLRKTVEGDDLSKLDAVERVIRTTADARFWLDTMRTIDPDMITRVYFDFVEAA